MATEQSLSAGTVKLLKRGWTFSQVPAAAILDSELPSGAFRLLSYMCWRRNQEGELWPGIGTMAGDMAVTEQTVRNWLDALVAQKYVSVTARTGETNLYLMTPKATSASITEIDPPKNLAPSPSKKVYPSPSKTFDPNDIHLNDKHSNERVPPATRERAKPASPDARRTHSAIRAIQSVKGTKSLPPKALWDDLIAAIGEHPDVGKLTACYKAWLSKGYNKESWIWVTEWMRTGIPQRTNGYTPPPPPPEKPKTRKAVKLVHGVTGEEIEAYTYVEDSR